MTAIDNFQDVIDSRDVIARIEHLEQLRQPGPVDLGEDNAADQDSLFAELAALEKLAAEAEQYADDWEYGAQLIRESYFTEYARELCEETGCVPENLPHYIVVDWEATARNIKADYTTVDFAGVAYLVR
jgi:hypothetical protein